MSDFSPLTFSIRKKEWDMSPQFHDFLNFMDLIERDSKGVYINIDRRRADKIKDVYLWGLLNSNQTHEGALKKINDFKRTKGANQTGERLVKMILDHIAFDLRFQKQLENLSKVESPKKQTEESSFDKPEKSDVGESKPISDEGDSVDRLQFKNTEKIKQGSKVEVKSVPIE